MTTLKNGLYVRRIGPTPVSAFPTVPGVYTLQGSYKRALEAFETAPGMVGFIVLEDPVVAEIFQSSMERYEKEKTDAKAAGKPEPRAPKMGPDIAIIKLGDDTPLPFFADNLKFIGTCGDLFFFSVEHPSPFPFMGMF